MNETLYGLIFDVDGVIADTESLSATVTAGVLLELFDIQGVTYDDFNAGRGRGAEAYLKAAAGKHGVLLDSEQIHRAEETREKRMIDFIQQNALPPYPGVIELMHAGLQDPRMRIAIATSSTRKKSQMVLTSTGVPYQKMIYITGSDVCNKKPHPELFLTAASRLNIAPKRCLVIEDAPSGIEAAIHAGCTCLAVTNSFHSDALSKAHHIVDTIEGISIADVIEWIKHD